MLEKKKGSLPNPEDVRVHLYSLDFDTVVNIYNEVYNSIMNWPEDEQCDFYYYTADGYPGPAATLVIEAKLDEVFGIKVPTCLRVATDFLEQEIFDEINLEEYSENESIQYVKHMGVGRAVYYPYLIDKGGDSKEDVADFLMNTLHKYFTKS